MKRTTLGIAALIVSFICMALLGLTRNDPAESGKDQSTATIGAPTPLPTRANPSDPTPTGSPYKNPSDPTPTRSPYKNPSDPTPTKSPYKNPSDPTPTPVSLAETGLDL